MREFFYRTHYRLFDRKMGAGDLETAGFLGRTIIGGLRLWDGEPFQSFAATDQMLQSMIETPVAIKGGHPEARHSSGTIWFHNWANFDGGRFVEALYDLHLARPDIRIELIPQGGDKLIAVVMTIPQPGDPKRTYRVTIADSFALFPAKLKDITNAMVPDMAKLTPCAIPAHDFTSGGEFSPACPDCMAYLQRDVDSLQAAMTRLESLLHEVFRSPITITNPSAAWKASKTLVPEGHVWYRSAAETEAWLRPAIHGGFVWPGHKRGERGPAVVFDHSGAYAGQLRHGLPYGHPVYRDTYQPDLPGVWDAEVTVPADINIPILCGPPGGPTYPTGTFRHKFTNIELNYAEKLGCTFQPIEGVTWDGYEFIFNTFVDKCEAIEYPANGASPDPAMKNLVKLMRNGLVGRFATKPEAIKWEFGTDLGEGQIVMMDEETGTPLPIIGTPQTIEGASYIHPEWNIFVTARQRIAIHQVLNAGGEGAYYADTDSAVLAPETADKLIAAGTINRPEERGYGLFHIDALFDQFWVGGPKNKIGVKATGETVITAKGIPKKVRMDRVAEQIASTRGVAEEVSFESVFSFKSRLLDPKKPYGVVRTRRYSILENSTSWTVDDHDNIRPRPALG